MQEDLEKTKISNEFANFEYQKQLKALQDKNETLKEERKKIHVINRKECFFVLCFN